MAFVLAALAVTAVAGPPATTPPGPLEFTGTIDNAIDRLVAKRELVEVELRELDNMLAGAQAPLERLHQLTEEERRLQDKLRDLENERRAGLAARHGTGVIPEYCALLDDDLPPVTRVPARSVAVVAARVGKTRLLDNVVLGEGVGADPRVNP